MLDCFKAIMEDPWRFTWGWEKSIIPPIREAKRSRSPLGLWRTHSYILWTWNQFYYPPSLHPVHFFSLFTACCHLFISLFSYLLSIHSPRRLRGPRGQEDGFILPPSSAHSKHRGKKKSLLNAWMNEPENEQTGQNDDISDSILCFLL